MAGYWAATISVFIKCLLEMNLINIKYYCLYCIRHTGSSLVSSLWKSSLILVYHIVVKEKHIFSSRSCVVFHNYYVILWRYLYTYLVDRIILLHAWYVHKTPRKHFKINNNFKWKLSAIMTQKLFSTARKVIFSNVMSICFQRIFYHLYYTD